MTSNARLNQDLLAILACDITARPAGAPHFVDVVTAVSAIHRQAAALLVDYDPAAAAQVTGVVAAERRCCAEIGWHLEGPVSGGTTASGAPALRMRIEASPAQLDLIQLLFAGPVSFSAEGQRGAGVPADRIRLL
jgi:hypothetical protein